MAEGQLWLLKKRDANREWQKSQGQVEKLVNQLEAQTADLRKSESQLELSRQAFYAASETINQAQAAYYEANAEVSQLENQLKQNTEARERMALQLQQLSQQAERQLQARAVAQQTLMQHEQEAMQADEHSVQTTADLDALRQNIPEKEQTLKEAARLAENGQKNLAQARQTREIERNNLHYLNQSTTRKQNARDTL